MEAIIKGKRIETREGKEKNKRGNGQKEGKKGKNKKKQKAVELVFVSRPPAGACSSQQGPAQQAKSGLLPPRAAQTSLAEEAKKTGKILKGPFFFAQINGFVKNALKTCNSPMKNGWKILMRHFLKNPLGKCILS